MTRVVRPNVRGHGDAATLDPNRSRATGRAGCFRRCTYPGSTQDEAAVRGDTRGVSKLKAWQEPQQQSNSDLLNRLRVRNWAGGNDHYVEFDEPAHFARIGDNPEMDTSSLRYGYTSLTTPNSTYDYDMTKRERVLRKRVEVLGGFNPDNYKTERRFARARDGQRVPISIVYRKTTPLNGKSPLLLQGYGSYGSSSEAAFASPRSSLLDRGFVFAIAHIRGGQELGREWYESGRLLKKKNTFTDFIDCADYLVKEGYSARDRLYAMGGSAGGLLMGAVVNLRPDLFHGVVAAVPFVDVVTTMLDDTIPLTTFEYEEGGSPHQKVYYDYMLSYSPYDNVAPKAYPHLLVTTGLQDSQVQYWEPAKWVAKLRVLKTDKHRLLLYTNMGQATEGPRDGLSGIGRPPWNTTSCSTWRAKRPRSSHNPVLNNTNHEKPGVRSGSTWTKRHFSGPLGFGV